MSSEKARVIEMPAARTAARGRKVVAATQSAIDALPLDSGDWSVEGVPGLVVRCRRTSKVFRVERKVGNRVAKKTLGPIRLLEARRLAAKAWAELKPPPREGRITLERAWVDYLEQKRLAPRTKVLYADLLRYLDGWRRRTLEDLGNDRAGVRARYYEIARKHGVATAASVMRTFRAVYRYAARIDPSLPAAPTVAVDIAAPKPRDWALGPEELRQWWAAVQRLNLLKRIYWLTMLLTGARRDSVRLLRWKDVDLAHRVIHFSAAKGGRTYSVPMCARLARLLERWREDCPPTDGDWVFPSPRKPGEPLHPIIRDDKRGVASPHHLRHTYRTVLAQLGATPDQARLLLGHSLGGDVSRGYITPTLVIESLRPLAEAVSARYAEILDWPDKVL